MTLPKIYRPQSKSQKFFVRVETPDPSNNVLVCLCYEDGTPHEEGVLLRNNGERPEHEPGYPTHRMVLNAGIVLDEQYRWESNQCIETLVSELSRILSEDK